MKRQSDAEKRQLLEGKRFTVQHQKRKCKCKRCEEGGAEHGYYWFAYYYEEGRMHGVYLGKEIPAWTKEVLKEYRNGRNI